MVSKHKRNKKIRNITQRLLVAVDIRDSTKCVLSNMQLSEETTRELEEQHDEVQRWIDEDMDVLDKVVLRGGMTYEERRLKCM